MKNFKPSSCIKGSYYQWYEDKIIIDYKNIDDNYGFIVIRKINKNGNTGKLTASFDWSKTRGWRLITNTKSGWEKN